MKVEITGLSNELTSEQQSAIGRELLLALSTMINVNGVHVRFISEDE